MTSNSYYTKDKYSKAFTLYEILFSLIILSIILFTSINLIDSLNKENQKEKEILTTQIELESFRLFLEHKFSQGDNITSNDLKFVDNNIYYQDNILLKNVTTFNEKTTLKYLELSICLNINNTICQDMIFNKK